MGNLENPLYYFDPWIGWLPGYTGKEAAQTNLLWMDLSGTITDFYPTQITRTEPQNGASFAGCAYGARYLPGAYSHSGSTVLYGGRGYTGYIPGCN